MKGFGIRAGAIWLCLLVLISPVAAARLLVPVGQAVGLELELPGLTVAEVVPGGPAERAGIQTADLLCAVDHIPLDSPEKLIAHLAKTGGPVELELLRGGQRLTVTVTPEGQPLRLGLALRKGMAGIGTVTYYDPATGQFGALGHGVSDSGGALLPVPGGSVFRATVSDVEKGKIGKPGRLRGLFDLQTEIGRVEVNTACGVFGHSSQGWAGIPLPVAEEEEIRVGPATILSTVAGEQPREYSVEILKIYPQEKACGRNLMLRVTDSRLLEATGGIVQGMSGSPILQDGKLVGAVTHVLVNDPTRGYGIFIENMLDAAS